MGGIKWGKENLPHETLPHMPLTNLKVEKAKPQDKLYKLYDGSGLSLHDRVKN